MSGLTSAVKSSHVHSKKFLCVKLLPSKRTGIYLQRGRGGQYRGDQNSWGTVSAFRAMDENIFYNMETIRNI
jgi:hypothetical protein